MSSRESTKTGQSRIERVPNFESLTLSDVDHSIIIADAALPDAWFEGFDDPIRVDAGESLKSLTAIEELANRVLDRRSTRPLNIAAVGGGSVGDAVGFLASILWRGVELWHVPTTLLAMVDSAHGGKTAVNLGDAKNQLGTFYPAQRVVLVDEALATLPVEHRRDGLAELIKGLWLGDAAALDVLEADGGVDALAAAPFEVVGERLMELLKRAIDVKLDIVDRDMYETKGIRTFLNFGHTVAHTLELHSGISHGQAVYWGMLSASFLSSEQFGLSPEDSQRLRRHIYAVATPSQAISSFRDRDRFCSGIARDKKRVDGQLRSVSLRAPGEPFVTRDISADDWFDAFRTAVEWFEDTAARVERSAQYEATLDIEASKSEMNRALVIDYLRPGETAIEADSGADDVAWLKRCLQTLRRSDGRKSDDRTEIYCGEGGTTFRFLVALCAARDAETLIWAAPRLLERPHEPLFEALGNAGAEFESISKGGRVGVCVRGWSKWPSRIEVSAKQSSQYATAIALLAASSNDFELVLSEGGEVASRPYFEMTLDLLGTAGVEIDRRGEVLHFSPTARLYEPGILAPETDASSAAVWAMARLVGVDAEVTRPPVSGRQPDARALQLADRLKKADRRGDDKVVIDLGESPDLAPVLAAVCTRLGPQVEIVGAEHLRHKESDRIGDLASAFEEVGVDIEARDDGLVIPAGRQQPTDHAHFPTFGDHRLAMAGLLLSAAGTPLHIEAPMVVAKSYPDFWHHARRLGWIVSFSP